MYATPRYILSYSFLSLFLSFIFFIAFYYVVRSTLSVSVVYHLFLFVSTSHVFAFGFSSSSPLAPWPNSHFLLSTTTISIPPAYRYIYCDLALATRAPLSSLPAPAAVSLRRQNPVPVRVILVPPWVTLVPGLVILIPARVILVPARVGPVRFQQNTNRIEIHVRFAFFLLFCVLPCGLGCRCFLFVSVFFNFACFVAFGLL